MSDDYMMQGRIWDLENKVQKINEELNIWSLLDEKMVPYIYEKSLHKIVNNLNEIKFENKINCYKNKFKPKKDIPNSINQRRYDNLKWQKDLILLCTTSLRNSKEFYYSAKRASIDTQPILYYYSITYLFSFLIKSFIIFDNPVKHHGIYVYSTEGIKNIKFEFNKKGGFIQRLVNTLSILEYSSSFSAFILDQNDNYRFFLRDQKTDLTINNNTKMLLNNLIESDYEKDGNEMYMELNFLFGEFVTRYNLTSNIIKDFIIIFISGFIARYEPILWKSIYTGDESDLIYNINLSFGNINDMIRLVSTIISEVEHETFPGHNFSFQSCL